MIVKRGARAIVAFFLAEATIFVRERDIWRGTPPLGMPDQAYRSDCARCAALCCVLLAFDRSESFAFDKPALVACAHLRQHACGIHATRALRGFSGCCGYDCYGAGQRVTQELFAGRSWRDDASLIEPMARAFAALRSVQELRLLLATARQLPLDSTERAQLEGFAAALEPTVDPLAWSELEDFERGSLAREISDFLRSLRPRVPARRLPLAPGEAPRRALIPSRT